MSTCLENVANNSTEMTLTKNPFTKDFNLDIIIIAQGHINPLKERKSGINHKPNMIEVERTGVENITIFQRSIAKGKGFPPCPKKEA